MMEFKCPNCGDAEHLYRDADLTWMPDLGEWKLTYAAFEVECTECDHKFDYEGDD